MVVILCFPGITTIASTNTTIDTTAVAVRQPDSKFVDSYRLQKQFDYSQPPLSTSFSKQLWDYILNLFGGWNKISESMPLILKLLAAIFVLFFLFLVIFKTRIYTVFYSDKAIHSPDFELTVADETTIDFDEAIRKQIDQKQFRLAIRLLYLKVFNRLKINEYIHFSKEKTNVDYLHDLSNPNLKSRFLVITSLYNRIWYGDVEITEEQFLRFEKSFQSFYTTIDVQE